MAITLRAQIIKQRRVVEQADKAQLKLWHYLTDQLGTEHRGSRAGWKRFGVLHEAWQEACTELDGLEVQYKARNGRGRGTEWADAYWYNTGSIIFLKGPGSPGA